MKPRGFIAMVLVLVIGSTAQAGGAETSTTSADSQVAAASPSPYLEWLRQQLPRPRFEAGYVGSESCRQCHGEEFGSWHRSYHRTMTQPATADSVIGRFDGSTVDCGGLPYRVFQEGEGFWAEMPDPDVLMYVVQGGRKAEGIRLLEEGVLQIETGLGPANRRAIEARRRLDRYR
jgi:hypothetical protein